MDPYSEASSSNLTSAPIDLTSLLSLLQQSTATQSLFAPSIASAQIAGPSTLGTPGVMSSKVMQMFTVPQQSAQQQENPSMVHPSSSQRPLSTLDVLAGTLPDDESILVNALLSRTMRGWSVRRALEALHGVNYHTAGSWKDYFLENLDHLSQHIGIVNLPADHGPFSPRERTVPNTTDTSRTALRTRQHMALRPKPTSSQHRWARGRQQLRARQQAHFSDTPSRSPTPPLEPDVPLAKRKYTDAESEFALKSIKRQLSKDPYVSYKRMACVLAEKAPECGRTADSWRNFLGHRKRDEVERLIARARGKAPRRIAKVAAVPPRESESESSEDEEGSSSPTEWVSSNATEKRKNARDHSISDGHGTEDDIQSMGAAGKTMTHADFRMAARYIASRDPEDWQASTTQISRWAKFAQQHPQRTDKAWAKNYCTHQAVIDALVPRYKDQVQQLVNAGSKRSRREPEAIDVDDEQTVVASKRPRGAL